MSLREEFLRAYVGALCRLKVLTPGLSKIASEEAAKASLEKLGLKVEGGARDALSSLFSALGAEASIEEAEERFRVTIRRPCPLSWQSCESFCPLPHISSVHLSVLGRWLPKRSGASFVEASQEACTFQLVRAVESAKE